MDIQPTRTERRVIKNLLVQRNIRFDAFDHHFRKRIAHAGDGGVSIFAIGNQLADHRIVKRRDDVAAIQVRVDANAGAAGAVKKLHGAGRRNESLRVFCINAALDGVTAYLNVVLRPR